MKFHVDSDITVAETLPAHFYKSQEVFDLLKEKVFLKSWQWIGDAHILVPQPETVSPLVYWRLCKWTFNMCSWCK